MKTTNQLLLSLGAAIALGSIALAADPSSNPAPPKATATDATVVPSNGTSGAFGSAHDEIKEIRQKLKAMQDRSTNAPTVKAAIADYEAGQRELQAAQKKLGELQAKLREAVLTEVTKQNPSVKQLMEREQELFKQLGASAGPSGHGAMNRPARTSLPATHPAIEAGPNQPMPKAAPPED